MSAQNLFRLHNLFPRHIDARVLEIGCGMGRCLAMLKENGYSDLTGIDRDFSQIQIAKNEQGLKILMVDAIDFLTETSIEFLLRNSGLHYIAVRPEGGEESDEKKKLKQLWADLYKLEIGRVPIMSLNIVTIAFKDKEAFKFWKKNLPYLSDTYESILL
ncbi:MAG: class I SAM-dependent methyltransferase [Acidobacteria bacterium]|nr:class I SAM-dependent methyltransferase [Acidobacteriota bacterium]